MTVDQAKAVARSHFERELERIDKVREARLKSPDSRYLFIDGRRYQYQGNADQEQIDADAEAARAQAVTDAQAELQQAIRDIAIENNRQTLWRLTEKRGQLFVAV